MVTTSIMTPLIPPSIPSPSPLPPSPPSTTLPSPSTCALQSATQTHVIPPPSPSTSSLPHCLPLTTKLSPLMFGTPPYLPLHVVSCFWSCSFIRCLIRPKKAPLLAFLLCLPSLNTKVLWFSMPHPLLYTLEIVFHKEKTYSYVKLDHLDEAPFFFTQTNTIFRCEIGTFGWSSFLPQKRLHP